MEKISKKFFLVLVKAHIKRYRPFIIGITGSVGKTSTREAVKAVIGSQKRVRVSAGSLNNELGFALTVLGNWDQEYFEQGSSAWLWIRVFCAGLLGLLFRLNKPEIYILEYGADRPGDIRKLAKAVRPNIAVVTAIGEIPVHIEFFSGSEAVAREKSKLVEGLVPTGYAILNADDDVVLDMKEKTKARVLTYGFSDGASIKVSSFEYKVDGNMPIGVTFKLHYGSNSFVPVNINGSLGKSQAWSAAAAAAVGVALGLNLVEISDALSYYDGPKGRLKILAGIKNSWIIDDTYNASPSSTRLALSVLRELPAVRRVAVLGDMLELGKYTVQAHQTIGDLTDGFVDVLICVGARAKFIADSAENQLRRQEVGAPTSDASIGAGGASGMPEKRIYTFDTADMAKRKVQELVKEGDLILVKGSQGMRMERIVEEIMAEPLRKKELLVRQSKKWLSM
ncbi:MAG: UDP-N-acetylmuramoyl-tripeptide--D-alanyl-D-alanine ligase [Candidatus Yanofskybacteria bacterium]|nr:UDP-N-acetylmuramoyl-tripeptide--D-alanyl-D-alanine ligase [Candidatus Yanofskybacteria bacterium]